MLEPGVVVSDRYKILRVIGEGGMGAVYEAEHTGVGRKVAVKVLHPEFAKNPEICGRFEREARAAAEVGHDNIIDVLDVGTHDGQPFMVMEILKGESLATRIERTGPLSPEAAAYVMGQVLSALSAAHAVGIIHRDLKPDNVFLTTKAGVRDFVKLLDFGISKFKDTAKTGPRGGTQTGALMGTPVYMSPEQALAKRDIDARADLYSAGVMLYETVTGAIPFDAESQAELLMAIVYRPNGLKRAREVRPDLPEAFDAVIDKAMAKDREGRFQTAAEFAEALAPWIGAAPPAEATGAHTAVEKPAKRQTLTPTQWEKSAPKDVRGEATKSKSRGIWIGVAGVMVIGAAAAGVFAFRGHEARHETATATTTARAGTTSQTPAAPETTVSVDLAGLPSGATVRIDGQASSGTHFTFVRGSTHTLDVTADGRSPFQTSFTAERDREIMIALPALSVAAPSPAPSQPATHPSTPPSERPIATSSAAATRNVARPTSTASAPAAPPPTTTHPTAPTAPRTNPLPVSNEF